MAAEAQEIFDPLPALLEDARAMYESDIWLDQLVSEAPPVTLDRRLGILREEPAARIGMTVSGRVLRLIGHPAGYGRAHPWLHSLYRLGWYCRNEHHDHAERRAWRGALCAQLVRLVVVDQLPLPATCQVLELDVERTRPVLANALRWIESDVDARREDDERRGAIERDHLATETLLALFARQHDVAREARVWTRLRRRWHLRPWEDELERRERFHTEKGCPRCPLPELRDVSPRLTVDSMR